MKVQPSSIVVSFNTPHRISECELTGKTLLGYTDNMLQGRSIRILQGTKTNSELLRAAIKNSALNNRTSTRLYLYDTDGECHNVAVTCIPICDVHGIPQSCQLFVCPEIRDIGNNGARDQLPQVDRISTFVPALKRDPLPSPYVRQQLGKTFPDINRPLPPGMKPIIWQRISPST